MRRPSDSPRGTVLALAAVALVALASGACGDDGAREDPDASSDRKTPSEACEGLAPCDLCVTDPGCGSDDTEEGGACPDEYCTAEGLCESGRPPACEGGSSSSQTAGGGGGQGATGAGGAGSGPSGTGGS